MKSQQCLQGLPLKQGTFMSNVTLSQSPSSVVISPLRKFTFPYLPASSNRGHANVPCCIGRQHPFAVIVSLAFHRDLHNFVVVSPEGIVRIHHLPVPCKDRIIYVVCCCIVIGGIRLLLVPCHQHSHH